MDQLLTALGLSVGYADGHMRRRGLVKGSTVTKTILSDINITLLPGKVTILVGPNGSGKSTLLRTLAGLQHPVEGQILSQGKDLDQLSRREIARRIAFLPQSPIVPAGLTTREVVRHGRYAHRGPLARHTADDHEAIDWAMQATETTLFHNRRLDELSGGERQRVWLATVLAQRAPVLLLDEPTTYLDLRHQLDVLGVVRQLADEHHVACGLVLHDLGHAAAYADHVVMLAHGRVIAQGDPMQVMTSENLQTAFNLDVAVVRDPESGQAVCLPRTPVRV